jgi:hypothetical protein
MKTIYALSGGSGIGKTFTRNTDPKLKDLPYLDIADIYNQCPGISAAMAWSLFEEALIPLLDEHSVVVLEAYFRPGSYQRRRLEYIAEANGFTVQYIEPEADKQTRIARVKAQYHQAVSKQPEKPWHRRYLDARLYLIEAE